MFFTLAGSSRLIIVVQGAECTPAKPFSINPTLFQAFPRRSHVCPTGQRTYLIEWKSTTFFQFVVICRLG
jgi:hypothetical protein